MSIIAMEKIDKKLQKELASLSEDEYFQFLQVLYSFNFVSRMIHERMEYDSDEKFLDQMFFEMITQYFINPLYQTLQSVHSALKVKPENRWEETSAHTRNMYYEWKKINKLPWKKRIKPMMKFYKKHFHDELMEIRK